MQLLKKRYVVTVIVDPTELTDKNQYRLMNALEEKARDYTGVYGAEVTVVSDDARPVEVPDPVPPPGATDAQESAFYDEWDRKHVLPLL